MARAFQEGEKHRDDLFAGTPPLEAKKFLISRAMTRRTDGRRRKLLVVDARKAHLNSKCDISILDAWQWYCLKLDFYPPWVKKKTLLKKIKRGIVISLCATKCTKKYKSWNGDTAQTKNFTCTND